MRARLANEIGILISLRQVIQFIYLLGFDLARLPVSVADTVDFVDFGHNLHGLLIPKPQIQDHIHGFELRHIQLNHLFEHVSNAIRNEFLEGMVIHPVQLKLVFTVIVLLVFQSSYLYEALQNLFHNHLGDDHVLLECAETYLGSYTHDLVLDQSRIHYLF